MRKRAAAAVFLAAVFLPPAASDQTRSAGLYASGEIRSAEEGLAAEEFRRGIQAYYRGGYNEAVLQFEKALSYMPEDNLILEWLGNSYYHAGIEGTALQEWQKASESGYGGLLLRNKIEIVRERRVPALAFNRETRYVEAGGFSGVFDGNMIFSGPVSVLPNPDGTAWVLAYGSNELLLLDINGLVISRITGPLNGFDRPVCIVRLADKSLLVSESAGDRLALLDRNGRFVRYYGARGRGEGQFLGPQHIAQDARQNIYVTDYGNSRVVVLDKDGAGLFSFGEAKDGFPGLEGPTGIAIDGDRVFVADDVRGCVYEFDSAGNYRRVLVEEKTLVRPEGMRIQDHRLVICDANRIVSADCETGAVFENARTGNAPSRLTDCAPDVNGNVLAADITAGEVYVLSDMQELVGGLFVQIERVNAEQFPSVKVELKVEDRHRRPVVGLKENNFYLTEQKRPVSQMRLDWAASVNGYADITVLVDRSPQSAACGEQIGAAVRELAAAMDGAGTLRIVAAGEVPAQEFAGNPAGALRFSVRDLKTPVSETVPLDLALRLAVNGLINAEKKRAVVFVSAGKVTQGAFSKYSLSETAAYMNNNSVPLSVVTAGGGAPDEELSYLVSATPGKEYSALRPEGLSAVVGDLTEIPSGLYQLSYTSVLQTNFGEKFLPVEAEVYFFNRSGRAESGYFAPLQ